ncbi:hypothetical protein Q8F55_001292 [Vanrija albida]|uniref:Mid2 domain-containing protein n=1 Tax=Vanrija albida TaxID=181172 RepID=A0ABR3QFK6_9TREE
MSARTAAVSLSPSGTTTATRAASSNPALSVSAEMDFASQCSLLWFKYKYAGSAPPLSFYVVDSRNHTHPLTYDVVRTNGTGGLLTTRLEAAAPGMAHLEVSDASGQRAASGPFTVTPGGACMPPTGKAPVPPGAIAGAAVGGVLVLAILALVAWWYRRRRRRRELEAAEDDARPPLLYKEGSFNFTGSVPPLSFNLLDAHYRLVDFVSNSSTQTSGTSSLLMRIGQGGRAVYLEVVDAWGAQETSTPLTVSGGSFECMRPPQSHRVRSSTTPVIAGAVSAVVGVIAVVGAALLFHRVYSRRRAKLEKERDEPAPPYDDVGLPPPYKASN